MSGRGTIIVIIALIQLLLVKLSPSTISADSIHLIECGLDAVSADSTHFIYKVIPFSFMLCCEKEVMGNCYNKLFSSLSYLSFCKRLP